MVNAHCILTTRTKVRQRFDDLYPLCTMEEGEDSSCAVDVGPPGHPELVAKAKKLVASLLSDPFLSDLPSDVTAEEVSSIVALEQGKAITVYVKRFDQQIIREQ